MNVWLGWVVFLTTQRYFWSSIIDGRLCNLWTTTANKEWEEDEASEEAQRSSVSEGMANKGQLNSSPKRAVHRQLFSSNLAASSF
jgi:hypothetical protein